MTPQLVQQADSDSAEIAPAELQRLGQLVQWRRLEYASGPLQQALVLILADPIRSRCRCTLRLGLRNGLVCALVVSGEAGTILSILPLLASRLIEQPAADLTHPDAARCLDALASPHVRVQLEGHAALLPALPVSENMLAQLQLTGLNHLRSSLNLAPAQGLPRALQTAGAATATLHHPAVQAYQQGLDRLAATYCTASVPLREQLAVYNFLMQQGGAYCRYRLQAIQVLPWLLPALMNAVAASPAWGARPLQPEWPQRIVAIQHGIDQGAPLFETVASVLGVPRTTVRWLGQRALPVAWTLDMRRVQALLRLLSWLPPEHRPCTPAAFEQLVRAGDALLAPLRDLGQVERVPDFTRPQYGDIVRNWMRELGAVDGNALPFVAVHRALADARDYLVAVFGALCQRSAVDPAQQLGALLDRLCRVSMRRLLAQSDAWHAAAAHYATEAQQGTAAGADLTRWPLVLPQPWAHAGITIRELASADDLMREGSAMQHCIGSYADACAAEGSVAFSLCDAEGQRCSTAELRLLEGGRGLAVVQHRGLRNGAPQPACAQALAALLTHLHGAEFDALRMARHESQQQAARRRRRHTVALDTAQARYRQRLQQVALAIFEGRPVPNTGAA